MLVDDATLSAAVARLNRINALNQNEHEGQLREVRFRWSVSKFAKRNVTASCPCSSLGRQRVWLWNLWLPGYLGMDIVLR